MASCSKPSITKYEKMIHEHCEVLHPCAVFTAHTRSLLLAAEFFFFFFLKYTKSPIIVQFFFKRDWKSLYHSLVIFSKVNWYFTRNKIYFKSSFFLLFSIVMFMFWFKSLAQCMYYMFAFECIITVCIRIFILL